MGEVPFGHRCIVEVRWRGRGDVEAVRYRYPHSEGRI